jgi:predicted O-methyltransferase YrrM
MRAVKLLLKELSAAAGSAVRAAVAAMLIFNIILFALGGSDYAVVSIAGTAFGMTLILVQLSRRLQRTLLAEIREIYKKKQRTLVAEVYDQVQSFISLVNWMKPRRALPSFGGWAITPDLALELATLIHRRRPSHIVELGSGASTIVLGYCAQSVGATVLSLEHLEDYVGTTSRMVEDHELHDVVSVVHAPLTDVEIDGRTWQWYRTDSLRQIERIDMLFVDGPPGRVQAMSRYPVFPILFGKLSSGFFAVLDDADRLDEQRILQEWQTRMPDLVVERLGAKRAVLISFASAGGAKELSG